MNKLGLEWPADVSVIGFGDEEWSEIINPPLTMLKQDTKQMALEAVSMLLDIMDHGPGEAREIKVPMTFSIQNSTQVIGKGPFGEKPVSPMN